MARAGLRQARPSRLICKAFCHIVIWLLEPRKNGTLPAGQLTRLLACAHVALSALLFLSANAGHLDAQCSQLILMDGTVVSASRSGKLRFTIRLALVTVSCLGFCAVGCVMNRWPPVPVSQMRAGRSRFRGMAVRQPIHRLRSSHICWKMAAPNLPFARIRRWRICIGQRQGTVAMTG